MYCKKKKFGVLRWFKSIIQRKPKNGLKEVLIDSYCSVLGHWTFFNNFKRATREDFAKKILPPHEQKRLVMLERTDEALKIVYNASPIQFRVHLITFAKSHIFTKSRFRQIGVIFSAIVFEKN
jgi:hypothetical protein